MAAELKREIFHSPCAFGAYGTTKELCDTTTKIAGHNRRCAEIKCTSPLRACRICVTLSAPPNRVVDPVRGLCKLHLESEDAAPSPLSKPKPAVVSRQPGWARGLTDHGRKLPVPNVSRPAPTLVPTTRRPAEPFPVREQPIREVSVTVVPPAKALGVPRVMGKPVKPKPPRKVRAAKLAGAPVRKESLGLTKFFDPESGQMVRRSVLEALAIARRLNLDEGLTRAQIGKRMQVSEAQIVNLERIDLLIPEVRQLLSTELAPYERLSMGAAIVIAYFRDDLQLEVARQNIAGAVSIPGLWEMLAEPGNKRLEKKESGWQHARSKKPNRRDPIEKLIIRGKKLAAMVDEIDGIYQELQKSDEALESSDRERLNDLFRPTLEKLSKLIKRG